MDNKVLETVPWLVLSKSLVSAPLPRPDRTGMSHQGIHGVHDAPPDGSTSGRCAVCQLGVALMEAPAMQVDHMGTSRLHFHGQFGARERDHFQFLHSAE